MKTATLKSAWQMPTGIVSLTNITLVAATVIACVRELVPPWAIDTAVGGVVSVAFLGLGLCAVRRDRLMSDAGVTATIFDAANAFLHGIAPLALVAALMSTRRRPTDDDPLVAPSAITLAGVAAGYSVLMYLGLAYRYTLDASELAILGLGATALALAACVAARQLRKIAGAAEPHRRAGAERIA